MPEQWEEKFADQFQQTVPQGFFQRESQDIGTSRREILGQMGEHVITEY